MICASVNRVFFIGISSFILPRKFFFRIPLLKGGAITPPQTFSCRQSGDTASDDMVANIHSVFQHDLAPL